MVSISGGRCAEHATTVGSIRALERKSPSAPRCTPKPSRRAHPSAHARSLRDARKPHVALEQPPQRRVVEQRLGLPTPSPPKVDAASQCALVLSIVQLSVRYTWLASKPDHTPSMSSIACSKFAARDASTAALIAPAEVPDRMAKGLWVPFGRIDAIAFNTPTWYAPRAPAPGRTKSFAKGFSHSRASAPRRARMAR